MHKTSFGNLALSGKYTFSIKVDPLILEFKNQVKNICDSTEFLDRKANRFRGS